ncbi:hypothetical protein NEOLI_001224 [Neolecta irregularis DAH-3]|uniref:MICOS complex subunit n=1 Tax=Neolecta irregularis (strain DAH-3) TaxID=1198029 RepID=A0A1U7LRV0_NEOID|nr:hypothetical protein NEOLI_001224 [Neolecta irregularis DAH-3]|eukprot:OLL25400.1 hypothetical protein NEOLI_001224 [Neolecta irregularis DAH-3]
MVTSLRWIIKRMLPFTGVFPRTALIAVSQKDENPSPNLTHIFTKSSKLSIYDPPEPTLVLEELPPMLLQTHFRIGREWVNKKYRHTRCGIDNLVDRWISLEGKIEKTANEVKPMNGEKVMPGGMYVVISGMAGSILSRNRLFPVRLAMPILTSIGAAIYFLPQTSRNIGALLLKIERKIPKLEKVHNQIHNQLLEAVEYAERTKEQGQRTIEESVYRSRKFVEASTGLPVAQDRTE